MAVPDHHSIHWNSTNSKNVKVLRSSGELDDNWEIKGDAYKFVPDGPFLITLYRMRLNCDEFDEKTVLLSDFRLWNSPSKIN